MRAKRRYVFSEVMIQLVVKCVLSQSTSYTVQSRITNTYYSRFCSITIRVLMRSSTSLHFKKWSSSLVKSGNAHAVHLDFRWVRNILGPVPLLRKFFLFFSPTPMISTRSKFERERHMERGVQLSYTFVSRKTRVGDKRTVHNLRRTTTGSTVCASSPPKRKIGVSSSMQHQVSTRRWVQSTWGTQTPRLPIKGTSTT